jgi:hypothetical protein
MARGTGAGRTFNPPMAQVIGGWFGAMIVLGIAGGYLYGPAEVTLHVTPLPPAPAPGDRCGSLAAAPAGAGHCVAP